MTIEFLLEVFFIKIKVKGYLKNKTENTEEIIDTNAIFQKEKITFINNEIKYKIFLTNQKITIIRENKDFNHGMIFIENKKTLTKYYIKELNSNIDLNIMTKKIELDNKKILIEYKIIENDNEFILYIEMSEKI